MPVAGHPDGGGEPGWPADQVRAALLEVAADRRTRSPVRVAEAGPWWDSPMHSAGPPDEDLPALEERLSELGGHRAALQAQARSSSRPASATRPRSATRTT